MEHNVSEACAEVTYARETIRFQSLHISHIINQFHLKHRKKPIYWVVGKKQTHNITTWFNDGGYRRGKIGTHNMRHVLSKGRTYYSLFSLLGQKLIYLSLIHLFLAIQQQRGKRINNLPHSARGTKSHLNHPKRPLLFPSRNQQICNC